MTRFKILVNNVLFQNIQNVRMSNLFSFSKNLFKNDTFESQPGNASDLIYGFN